MDAESVEGRANSLEAILDGRGLLGPRSVKMPAEALFELEKGLKLLVENIREGVGLEFALVDVFALL